MSTETRGRSMVDGTPPTWESTAIRYWNEVDRGGHFAAWEQPQLFCAEVRAAFRPLR